MKLIGTLLLVVIGAANCCGAETPDFQREVRPLLAKHCWKCHGLDAEARQGGLRLDERKAAVAPAESGRAAIVPGKPANSELMRRVETQDAARRMPPPDAGRALTPSEVAMLRRWIESGAEYRRHWAFEPLRKAVPPPHEGGRNPIDAYVAAEHRARGLRFAPESDRATLLRRASLDLTGLPPSLDDRERLETESFEETVDRLLSSPALGERLATDWLDAARYADTDGYFGDKPRQVWLWRDWTIRAFNEGMPYDQFTIEQLAGDLVPNATVAQRVATGFNRNHMANDETGLIDEEFRVEYVFDRVETTMSTWLGLTAGCAQCHDHKYDPLSQREYYQLFSLFNNVPERGLLVGSNGPPKITVLTAEQERELQRLATERAATDQAYGPLREASQRRMLAESERWQSEMSEPPSDSLVLQVSLDDAAELERSQGVLEKRGTSLISAGGIRRGAVRFDATQHLEANLPSWQLDSPWSLGLWVLPEGSLSCPISRIEPTGDRRGFELLWQKGRLAVHLVHRWGVDALEVVTRETFSPNTWHHVVVVNRGVKDEQPRLALYVDGKPATLEVRRDSLTGSIANREPLRIGRRDEGLGFYGALDEARVIGEALKPVQVSNWSRDERLRPILEQPADKRTPADTERLLDAFIDRENDPPTLAVREAQRRAIIAERAARDAAPTALVMEEMTEPRETRVLERGRYDKPGERVSAGVPAALGNWPEGQPRNRLGFARWLVGDDCPLTARVAANRLWATCFGEGLVRTPHDFGAQGEPPTHLELLDFLACELRDSDWDLKAVLRKIVTSRTYRQESAIRGGNDRDSDPDNRWLARGPKVRLSYEMLRDQALAASGLLVRKVGGPSVKPFQPPGLWEDVSYNGNESYEVDAGEGRWRRSVYTFVKRQAPPPGLLLFDGPTREKCSLKRPRTNTPLQALVLLNDEAFWAAARELARNSLESESLPALPASDVNRKSEGVEIDRRRVTHLAAAVLTRRLEEQEITVWLAHLGRLRKALQGDPERRRRIVHGSDGGSSEIDSPSMIEWASWTVLAHTMLNLDETAVRP